MQEQKLSPKHEALSVVFTMLNAEYELAKRGDYRSEIEIDLSTVRGRAVHAAYLKGLQRAAKPIAESLIKYGDDLGGPFPYD